jgi:alpha-galactosidase
MSVGPIEPPRTTWIWRDLEGDAQPMSSVADVDVQAESSSEGTRITICADGPLARVALRWNRPAAVDALILGDVWERSYGNLQWCGVRPHRPLPWYWAATSRSGNRTVGAGVRVRPGAMASWTVDLSGFTLWLDLRSGMRPVLLDGRALHAATVLELSADRATSAFASVSKLVKALGGDALPVDRPVFGGNNWYYAYGVGFDADAVTRDAALVSELTGDGDVRPFSVIDAGWSEGGSAPGGPWTRGWKSFADMGNVADRIRNEGAVPGLWFRPLLTREPNSLAHGETIDGGWPLDPSRPETLHRLSEDIARFRRWGFNLIKHDFSTFDVLGTFLPGEKELPRNNSWTFADRSRTTAEILLELYHTISIAAADMTVLGCNTIGHLAAGLEHVHRIGDDTSGRRWERTRRMGINTLAFRLPQHRSFFVADADCIPATPKTPWGKNRQFLDLVARTGTALFVSIDPRSRDRTVDDDVRSAIRQLLHNSDNTAEPLDWISTSTPSHWAVNGETVRYEWQDAWGADPILE